MPKALVSILPEELITQSGPEPYRILVETRESDNVDIRWGPIFMAILLGDWASRAEEPCQPHMEELTGVGHPREENDVSTPTKILKVSSCTRERQELRERKSGKQLSQEGSSDLVGTTGTRCDGP